MCAIDCVLVGLDWVELRMQFILHVTYSCISHAYVLYFLIYLLYLNCVGAFLIVSFSLPLFLFTLVVSMAPKRKSTPARNPFHSGASSSSDSAPLSLRFWDMRVVILRGRVSIGPFCLRDVWVEWFMTYLICSFVCCGFVMDCQRGRLLGHMWFT